MYQTSVNFNKTIKKKSRKYFWTGEIVLKTGKIINFDDKHILKDSGYISNSCSGSNEIELGSVYAAEMGITLKLDELKEITLDGSIIKLYFNLVLENNETEKIPLGIFETTEANRTKKFVEIKGYDFMVKFNKTLSFKETSGTIYELLEFCCKKCSVELGISKEEIEKRRGNVGTFFVFKTVGAAAQDGVSFDELVRITKKANDNTRTMSVGFKGCTLPGAQEPMFHVPNGKMEVGQGIHGEPGVYEDDLKSAAEIAELLVSKVLSEKPNGTSNKIAVILDGLGSTKYEELFVVWGTVSELLTKAGYELVYPLVGEYVTSLDMQGIALSIQFLDDELEKYWLYPANTPSFRRGNSEVHHKKLYLNTDIQTEKVYEKGSEESIDLANKIVDALKNVKKVIEENEAKLAEIDSIAGDGDHGRGMVKGTSYAYEAAKEALENGAAAGDVLLEAGKAWAAKAGGTSGVLWGESIQSAAKVIGNHQALSKEILDNAVEAALDRMVKLGGAHLGDKTMVDVLEPFCMSLKNSKITNCKEAWLNACMIADNAAQETKNLLPKVGRARPQALRSLGTPDAGAVSMALVFRAFIIENH